MAVALAVAVVWLGFDFANPFLPLYIRELGVESVAEAALWSGLLVGLAPGLSALANPFWGLLADRFGPRPMLLRALVTFSLLLALMGLATSLWHLVALRIAIGLLGGFTALALALMITSGPRSRTAQALGALQAAQYVPLAVGPAVGGMLADSLGLRLNFFLAAGLCLVGALVVAALIPQSPPPPPRRSPENRASAVGPSQSWRTPRVLLPFAVLFIAYFVERSFVPVLPLYVSVLGAPPQAVASTAGLALAAGALASAASGPLSGRLASRYSLLWLMAAALGSALLLCLLVAFARDVGQFVALRVALGLLAGGLPTLAYTMGAQGTAQGKLGRQAGLLSSAALAANALGPMITGVIAAWDLRTVFLVDAALLGLALVLVASVGRRAATGPGSEDEAGGRQGAMGRALGGS
ncbi:MAG: MFS transporter [Chloroflexi bacterium]|nr:MFS transporter [Chloroflexota bacterium]